MRLGPKPAPSLAVTLPYPPGRAIAATIFVTSLLVRTRNGWFAARPSGTEDVYEIYAESFLSPGHLRSIQLEAQTLIGGSSVVPAPRAEEADGAALPALGDSLWGCAACYG